MAEGEQESGSVFDLERLRALAEMMREHDIAEVDLREGTQRLRVSRGWTSMSAAEPPRVHVAQSGGPPPLQQPREDATAADSANIILIRSPMVGTFYSKPNPKADSFVKVGDHIEPDTTVCIIEAMKMFNEIPAEVRGRIVAILVGDEEPVDHGKPLFKVDTSG